MKQEPVLIPIVMKNIFTPVEPQTLHPIILEHRHETFLEWKEPWSACGPEGNRLDAHITLRASVHDCINMQRAAAKSHGHPTMGDDYNHLLDFIAVHWAEVVERVQSEEAEDERLAGIASTSLFSPFSEEWYRARAEDVRYNGKTVSQYNYYLAIADAIQRTKLEAANAEVCQPEGAKKL